MNPAPYNRLVSQPEPTVTPVEPLVITTVVAGKPKPFTRGDSVMISDGPRISYPATYECSDGQYRSIVDNGGKRISVFNYKISHA